MKKPAAGLLIVGLLVVAPIPTLVMGLTALYVQRRNKKQDDSK